MTHQPGPPTILTIFGATGDLSERKLLPALFDLFLMGFLPMRFRIVGFSRKDLTHEMFRDFVAGAVRRKRRRISAVKLKKFLASVIYEQGIFDDPESYHRLGVALVGIDDAYGQCTNKLFYLSVPPAMYEIIFQNLAHSGLTIPCSDEMGWTRILVEKPFGHDAKTAERLDVMLGLLFREEQIFRIDHYLAKETIQNILTFRFSNELFGPVWNRGAIEKVEIRLLEAGGVGARGAFYDSLGALRDVGQNHLLQMLAVVAMENASTLDAFSIQHERARSLASLKTPSLQNVTRAQYRGYRDEEGVRGDSGTETYFKLVAYIDNDRWDGVPFILESGKAMSESRTEISVYFKKGGECICPRGEEAHHQNILTFRIQPDEGISLRFWAKKPGFEFALEPRTLSFLYKQTSRNALLPDAYERVLYDCIRGDRTLFTSTDEVKAAWRFVSPILAGWGKLPLHLYDKGDGDIDADER